MTIVGLIGAYVIANKKNKKLPAVVTVEDSLQKELDELKIESDTVSDEFSELEGQYMALQGQNEELLEVLEGQEINVECPCGKNTFVGVFVVNEPNEVKCESCKETLSISFQPQITLLPDEKTSEQIFDEVTEQISAIEEENGQ
jgi:hypothetical protein